MANKILISACLLGQPVRYDGTARAVYHETLQQWQQDGCLVPLCPEMEGGLPVPRAAAEIAAGDGYDVLRGSARVMTSNGEDVTHFFQCGAQQVLATCQQAGIRVAILKQNSPSCGSSHVHDGSFSSSLIPGSGVTAAVLRDAGVRVFGENELDAAIEYIQNMNNNDSSVCRQS